MPNEKFRFRGLEFRCNPRSVTVKRERRLVRFLSPGGGSLIQDLGAAPALISGEGEFFGEDADGDYRRLRALFDEGEPGLLQIPGQPLLTVRPLSLSMVKKAGPSLVGYRFTFLEEGSL